MIASAGKLRIGSLRCVESFDAAPIAEAPQQQFLQESCAAAAKIV
jgi:hypothetical protein